jgi:predicted membrane-bound mannosyltransferase
MPGSYMPQVRSTLFGDSRYRTVAILVGIVLLGAFLRFYHLGYRSLWFDEAVMYWNTQGTLLDVVNQNAQRNSAPPLYPYLLHFVSRLGDSEMVLRSSAFLAGVAAIPAMYLLASQFLSPNVALLCSLLTAVASPQIRYSQQAREYSITFLLAILMLWMFARFLNEVQWRNTLLLAPFFVLGIFTQYGLALLVLGLNIVLVFKLLSTVDRKPLLTKWAASQVLVAGGALVVYQVSLKSQMQFGQPFGGSGATPYLADGYWIDGSLKSLAKLGINNTLDLLTFAYGPLFLLLFAIGVGFLFALTLGNGRTAILMFFVPMACTFVAAAAQLYPYRGARQDIFLTPMIYVMAGFGVEYLLRIDKRRIAAYTLAFVLIFAGLFHSVFFYMNQRGPENLRPLVQTLSSTIEPEDRIYVYIGATPAFRYYYGEDLANVTFGERSWCQPSGYTDQLDDMFLEPGRVWLVFSHCQCDDCDAITGYTSQSRETEMIATEEGASLYLAR